MADETSSDAGIYSPAAPSGGHPVDPQDVALPPTSALRPLEGTAVTVALRDVLEPALAAALRRRLPAECAVHLVEVSLASPEWFRRNVHEPTCCYLLTAQPPRHAAPDQHSPPAWLWVDVAIEIAHPILDVLLGDSARRPPTTDRPLTAVERRLLQRLPEAAAEALTSALARTGHTVALADRAASPSPPPPSRQPAAVLTFRLSIRASAGPGHRDRTPARFADGTMRICLPAAMLAAALPTGSAELAQWAAIELSAALPDTSLPAADAAALAVGDILTTDTPVNGEVTVRLAGVAKFAARLGACDGRRAITITRPLPPPEPD